MARVLVTGGAGYVGCVLVPKLLAEGHEVVVYDLMLFGRDGLRPGPGLRVVEGDVRDTKTLANNLDGVDAVIHLACISNDPTFELNPVLSRSINFDCFEPMVLAAKDAGVRRFVYASTSSVYGVSDAPEVTEEHPLVPLTDYNRYKGLCEPLLLKHQAPDFVPVIVRPATVCGYSPRMRFDLVANIFTNQAIHDRRIRVFGGEQKRPMIHVEDVADVYVRLLSAPAAKVAAEIFNYSEANYRIAQLASIVKAVVEQEFPAGGAVRVEEVASNDPRSYHVTSRKIRDRLGYVPARTVADGVRDVCKAIRTGLLPGATTDDRYVNVKLVQRLGLR